MPFDAEKIDEIKDDLIGIEDQAIEQTQKSIQKGLEALTQRLQRSVILLDSDNGGIVSASKTNIQQIQNFITAFAPAIQQVANDGKAELLSQFRPITKNLNKMLSTSGFDVDPEGAQFDAAVLGTLIDQNFNKFNGGASATTQALSDMMFSLVSSRATPDQWIKSIENTVLGDKDRAGAPLSRHAKTWAMTAINQYEGDFMQNAVDEKFIGGWYYSGPKDNANREFCYRRAGRTYSKEKASADTLQNPIGASGMNNPGGWNCRHTLVPVLPEDMPDDTDELNAPKPPKSKPVPAKITLPEVKKFLKGHISPQSELYQAGIGGGAISLRQDDDRRQIPRLSDSQYREMIESTQEFTGGGYTLVRSVMDGSYSKSAPKYIIERGGALAKHIGDFVDRSIPWNGDRLQRGLAFEKFESESEERFRAFAAMKPGDTFDDVGHTSWSTDRRVAARSFGRSNNESYNTVVLSVNGKTSGAATVRHFSNYDEEHEVVVKGGEKFRVKSVNRREFQSAEDVRETGGEILAIGSYVEIELEVIE